MIFSDQARGRRTGNFNPAEEETFRNGVHTFLLRRGFAGQVGTVQGGHPLALRSPQGEGGTRRKWKEKARVRGKFQTRASARPRS